MHLGALAARLEQQRLPIARGGVAAEPKEDGQLPQLQLVPRSGVEAGGGGGGRMAALLLAGQDGAEETVAVERHELRQRV